MNNTETKKNDSTKNTHIDSLNSSNIEPKQLAKELKDLKSKVKTFSSEQYKKTSKLIVNKPILSVGIAATTGILLGLFLRRRK